jgi:hypothetical protein
MEAICDCDGGDLDGRRSGIVMEMEAIWDGDCDGGDLGF